LCRGLDILKFDKNSTSVSYFNLGDWSFVWGAIPTKAPHGAGTEQMSKLHGTACYRQCGSFATELSRLDTYEKRKIVRWCRTQASSHNSQGVVDGRVIEVGMNTAAPDRSEVFCC